MYMSRQLDDQDDPLEAEWHSEDAHIHYQNHKIIQLYVKNNIFSIRYMEALKCEAGEE